MRAEGDEEEGGEERDAIAEMDKEELVALVKKQQKKSADVKVMITKLMEQRNKFLEKSKELSAQLDRQDEEKEAASAAAATEISDLKSLLKEKDQQLSTLADEAMTAQREHARALRERSAEIEERFTRERAALQESLLMYLEGDVVDPSEEMVGLLARVVQKQREQVREVSREKDQKIRDLSEKLAAKRRENEELVDEQRGVVEALGEQQRKLETILNSQDEQLNIVLSEDNATGVPALRTKLSALESQLKAIQDAPQTQTTTVTLPPSTFAQDQSPGELEELQSELTALEKRVGELQERMQRQEVDIANAVEDRETKKKTQEKEKEKEKETGEKTNDDSSDKLTALQVTSKEKEEEINNLNASMQERSEELRSVRGELTAVQEELQTTKVELEQVKTERDDLNRDLSEVKTERDGLNRELSEVKTERDGLNRELSEVKTERDDLNRELSEVKSERDDLNRVLSEVKAEQENLNKELNQVKTERDGARDNASKLKDDVKTERDEVQAELENTRTALEASHARQLQLVEQLAGKDTQIRELMMQMEEVTPAVTAQGLEQEKKYKEAMRDVTQLRKEVEELRGEIENRTTQIAELRGEIETRTATITQLNAELLSLQQTLSSSNNNNTNTTTTVVSENNNQNSGSNNPTTSSPPELSELNMAAIDISAELADAKFEYGNRLMQSQQEIQRLKDVEIALNEKIAKYKEMLQKARDSMAKLKEKATTHREAEEKLTEELQSVTEKLVGHETDITHLKRALDKIRIALAKGDESASFGEDDNIAEKSARIADQVIHATGETEDQLRQQVNAYQSQCANKDTEISRLTQLLQDTNRLADDKEGLEKKTADMKQLLVRANKRIEKAKQREAEWGAQRARAIRARKDLEAIVLHCNWRPALNPTPTAAAAAEDGSEGGVVIESERAIEPVDVAHCHVLMRCLVEGTMWCLIGGKFTEKQRRKRAHPKQQQQQKQKKKSIEDEPGGESDNSNLNLNLNLNPKEDAEEARVEADEVEVEVETEVVFWTTQSEFLRRKFEQFESKNPSGGKNASQKNNKGWNIDSTQEGEVVLPDGTVLPPTHQHVAVEQTTESLSRSWKATIATLTTEIQQLKEQLEKTEGERTSITEEYGRYKARAHSVLKDHAADLERAQAAQAEVEELRSRLAEAEGRQQSVETAVSAQRQQEILSLTADLHRTQDEKTRALEEVRGLSAELERATAQHKEAMEQEIRDHQLALENSRELVVRETEDLREELAAANHRIGQLSEELSAAQQAAASAPITSVFARPGDEVLKAPQSSSSASSSSSLLPSLSDEKQDLSTTTTTTISTTSPLESETAQTHIKRLQALLREKEVVACASRDREEDLLRRMAALERDAARNQHHLENVTYLKNVVVQYMATAQHEKLFPVIATLLQFTPEDVREIKTKRESASSSYFGGWI